MEKYMDPGNVMLGIILGIALVQIYTLRRELGRIEASSQDSILLSILDD